MYILDFYLFNYNMNIIDIYIVVSLFVVSI